MKALHILKIVLKDTIMSREKEYINEAIQELEDIKKNINTSIEEIEYALAKPEYASVYLNNALRFLKEKGINESNK